MSGALGNYKYVLYIVYPFKIIYNMLAFILTCHVAEDIIYGNMWLVGLTNYTDARCTKFFNSPPLGKNVETYWQKKARECRQAERALSKLYKFLMA